MGGKRLPPPPSAMGGSRLNGTAIRRGRTAIHRIGPRRAREAPYKPHMTNFDDPPIHSGRILFGAAIMVIGLIFLMDRLHVMGTELIATYWPLSLVAYGLTRIILPARPGAEVGGLWIALFGGLLLLDRLEIAPMGESWPVFLIVAGLMVVFRALGWLPSDRLHGEVSRNAGTRLADDAPTLGPGARHGADLPVDPGIGGHRRGPAVHARQPRRPRRPPLPAVLAHRDPRDRGGQPDVGARSSAARVRRSADVRRRGAAARPVGVRERQVLGSLAAPPGLLGWHDRLARVVRPLVAATCREAIRAASSAWWRS